MTSTPVVDVAGLYVNYGDRPAVHDVSLTVDRGEVFGFLGPNGAGKSSTIRVLLDLQRPTKGTVRLWGQDPEPAGAALRERMGYLPGDLALFPFLTGRQVLKLFDDLRTRPPILQPELIRRLAFPTEALHRKMRTYSTGMRQKLGLVCAMQHDPDLLILDEPTAGLDPTGRDAFLTLIRERSAAGKTVFLSSHILDEIERCVQRVGIIVNGRLRIQDTLDEVLKALPRRAVIRYAGRPPEVRTITGDVRELLRELALDEVEDLEIRRSTLDEVFRSVAEKGDELA